MEIFTFCEGGFARDGVLSLQNVCDSWGVDHTPTKIPRLALAVRVRFPLEKHTCDVRISLWGPNGEAISKPLDCAANVSTNHDGQSSSFLLKYKDVAVPLPGVYKAELSVDGKIMSAIPLFVRMLPVAHSVPKFAMN